HEGKSTTASNLAITLAQAGESVVLIDADLRRPTLADVFALSSGVGLTSVLLGDLDVHEALQPWRDDLPLQVLTAGPIPPNPAELIGSARMAALISELTGQGITVVLDSPPLLPVTDAALLARATDGALVVTRAASTHTDQLAAACEALRITGAAVLGVVLNRVPRTRGGSYYGGYAYGGYGSYRSAKQPQDGGAPAPEPARLPVAPAPARLAPSAVSTSGHEAPGVVSWPGAQGATTLQHPPSEPQPAEAFAQVPAVPGPSPHDSVAPPLPVPDPDTLIVLPPPDPLPDAVRAAISRGTPPAPPAPPAMQPPVDEHPGHPHARARGRRAARTTPEPDLIIDTDRGTATRSPVADETSWHVEWGDLPALIAGPRASEGLNGGSSRANGSSGRHRN
ncbi:MAG: polysaccharide biosynthesis tyrosine autokinase, partial [Kineosporiaceae bacterium]|nr:polysaccharide biosynthesis tyrosine autokinase [Kineosporiaceae bacterium]